MYAVAFLAALTVDTIPVFAPPAWTILMVLIIKFDLDPWLCAAAGAVGSTIGRGILSIYIPWLSKWTLSRREDDNVRYVGDRLGRRFWPCFLFVLAYSLTPLSTTALFTAAGIAKIRMLPVLSSFFCGKFLSDAAMIISGRYAAGASKGLLQRGFSWKNAMEMLVGTAVILGFMMIDWRVLLERKKVRFHLKFWA